MAHVRVIHDPGGETLTVYFADPRPDQVCEETGEGGDPDQGSSEWRGDWI